MKSTVQIKVRNYHLDRFGHVNNARYLEFLEEGRWTHSEENHLIEMYKKNSISHAAVNININYRKSAIEGDILFVETDVKERSDRSVTMHQIVLVKGTGTLIADATVTIVFMNAKTGKVISTDELAGFWADLSDLASSSRAS
jgi:thioesterase III